MLRSIYFWLAILVASLLPTFERASAETLSYVNLTAREPNREFYRSAARSYRNKRVHLHVDAARLLGKPSRIATTSTGGKVQVFENQSVPLIVNPSDTYFRKILARTKVGDRICVRGAIRKEPKGGKDRLALYVHILKRAHDKSTKKSRKSS